jgi:hypothetical protein
VSGSKSVGHLALRHALDRETFDPIFRGSPVFAQFSSLGSLEAKWVYSEFQAATLSAGKYLAEDGDALNPKPFFPVCRQIPGEGW